MLLGNDAGHGCFPKLFSSTAVENRHGLALGAGTLLSYRRTVGIRCLPAKFQNLALSSVLSDAERRL
jgi:hypothetical protein